MFESIEHILLGGMCKAVPSGKSQIDLDQRNVPNLSRLLHALDLLDVTSKTWYGGYSIPDILMKGNSTDMGEEIVIQKTPTHARFEWSIAL